MIVQYAHFERSCDEVKAVLRNVTLAKASMSLFSKRMITSHQAVKEE